MASDIENAMMISAHGMRAQGARIRVISENIANADTTANTPDEEPYTRQQIVFKNEVDRELDLKLIEIKEITQDKSKPYPEKYMPDHPGASESGMVRLSNVNTMIEMMDAREAQRTYEANLGMIDQSRTMIARTIDMLR